MPECTQDSSYRDADYLYSKTVYRNADEWRAQTQMWDSRCDEVYINGLIAAIIGKLILFTSLGWAQRTTRVSEANNREANFKII